MLSSIATLQSVQMRIMHAKDTTFQQPGRYLLPANLTHVTHYQYHHDGIGIFLSRIVHWHRSEVDMLQTESRQGA